MLDNTTWRLSLAAAWAVALLAGPATAQQTYYVGSGGSDNNPGTQTQPFATIQKALNTVTSGGTVDVLSGVYRNQFNTQFKSDNVTLQAAPGASVTVSGADLVTGWTQVASSGVYESTGWTNYFGPGNGSGTAPSLPRDQLFVNGAYLQEVTSQAAVTPGTFYINPTSQAIYLQLAGNANPNAGTVECTATASPLLSTNGHNNDLIQGLNFVACANNPQSGSAAVQITGGSGNIVNNISVKYAAGAGLGTSGGTNAQILNSTFNYNGQEGLASTGATNLTVQNCATSYNNTLPGKQFDTGWEAGGNKFTTSTNTVVNGLVSVGNVGSGIWFDINNQNATVTNCLVNGNGDGIHYEISYGGQIYNNLVSSSRFSRDQIGFNPTTLNPYSPSSQGIYLSSSAYCNVYNNTVVNNDNVGIVSGGPVRGDGSANNYNVYSYGSNLVNNIGSKNSAYHDPASGAGNFFEYEVSNVGGNTNTTGVANLSPSAPWIQSTSNYNLFQVNENFESWTYTSFPSWQTGTSQDLHSLATDPLFGSAAAGNYTLQPGSPAISAGTTGSVGMSATLGVNFATLAAQPGMTSTAYNVGSGSTAAVTTALSGSGGLAQTGTGLLILSGANSYQGPTTISGGTLQIAGGFDRLPTLSAVSMAAGTVLDLNGNPQTIGSLSGSGSVLNSSALTVGGDSTDTTFSGAISGSGDLLKTGVGTLTLAGTNTYGGKTSINAGILQVGNYGGAGTLGPGNVLDNATLMFSRSGIVTVANSISGNGNLIQAGVGTLVLTGTSSYSGGTYIDGGTLQLAGGPNRLPIGTEVTLRTGVLDLNGNNQVIGSLANISSSSGGGASSVTLGSATLSIGDGTNSNYAYGISGSGSLVLIGSGTVSLSGNNTYSGGTTVSAGNLVLGSTASIPAVGKILIQSRGALDVSGAYATVTAWLNSNAIHPASAGALALTGSSNESINLAVTGNGAYSSISLGSVGVNTYSGTLIPAGNTYYLGGGGGTLVMANNGALLDSTSAARSLAVNGNVTLAGSNGYSGGTTINAGLLSLAGPASLSSGGGIAFGGGTLQFTAGNAVDYSGRIANSSGPISVDTNGQNVIFGSALNGSNSGGLTKIGAGTLTLNASNSYGGVTNLNAGLLSLGNSAALAGGGAIAFGGGTLQFTVADTQDYSGSVTSSAGPISIDTNGQNVSFGSALGNSNNGGLTKIGAGTLTLGGNNTYAGNTLISSGTLALGNALALQDSTLDTSGSGTLNFGGLASATFGGLINGGSLALSNAASGAVALSVGNNGASTTCAATIRGAGSLTKVGTGNLTLSAQSTFTGNLVINGGTVTCPTANSGNNTTLGENSGARTITVGNGGVLSFAKNNVFYGGGQSAAGLPTVVINGGLLSSTRYNAIGNVNLSGGTLDQNSTDGSGYQGYQFLGSITISGTAPSYITNSNGAHDQLLASGIAFNVGSTGAGGADLTVSAGLMNESGDYGNGGASSLVKTGLGTMLLASSLNSYSGTTTVSAGTLSLSGGLTGGGAIAVASGAGFTQGSTGFISGASTLTSSGATTLSGSNTYTGATTVVAGQLLVNGSLASPVTVDSGGTLGGTGSLASVTVNANGNLAPGDLLGTLNVSGSLVLSSGAVMEYELDTPSTSSMMDAGALALNGQQFSDFKFAPLANFGPGLYHLIDAGSVSGSLGASTSGTFDGYTATLAVQNNDLVLTVVPEPSTLALLLAGVLGLIGWAWRRS